MRASNELRRAGLPSVGASCQAKPGAAQEHMAIHSFGAVDAATDAARVKQLGGV